MYKLTVLGISGHNLTSEQQELVSACSLLVCGRRFLDLVPQPRPDFIAITPLQRAIPAIRQALDHGDVLVLASGDPLFFGIGRRLIKELGPEQVEVQPALSSMQEAMARFKQPWEDAALLSLHGRKGLHVPGLLLEHPKSIVFTDGDHSPDLLARQLITYLDLIGERELLSTCRILVAENIGLVEERVFSGTLQEAAGRSFADLNVLCLLRPRKKRRERLGLTEEELVHSRGLITKDEVRAATLHRLRLPRRGVFWDVGSGSGSISIEAARMNPELTVYAVERKEEELANIKKNICIHGCYNVVPIGGLAPLVLRDLPAPDRVFVGGSGGMLSGIVAEAAGRLPAEGRLVVNGVTDGTVNEAPKLLCEAGLAVKTSTVKVIRTVHGKEPVVFNQIHIITGDR